MEEIVKSGRSIIYKGRVCNRIQDFDEADKCEPHKNLYSFYESGWRMPPPTKTLTATTKFDCPNCNNNIVVQQDTLFEDDKFLICGKCHYTFSEVEFNDILYPAGSNGLIIWLENTE